MRVAFVNQPWSRLDPPASRADSIAIWTWEVARRLARSDEVIVYTARAPDRPLVESVSGVTLRRVPLLVDPLLRDGALWRRALRRLGREMSGLAPSFDSPLYHASFVAQVAADARRREVDLIHVHNFSQFVPALRRLVPRARAVLHMHCDWLAQIDERTIARRLGHASAIIGCSAHVVDAIRMRFPGHAARCEVVPNGVDLEATDEAGGPAEGDGRTILFVGRVTPEKGVHVLIDAFARIAPRFPEARLEIVGPDAATPPQFLIGLSDDPRVRGLADLARGDYWRTLHARIPAGLRERVRLRGEVPRSELAVEYRAAAVLANPSFSESFGMSLIEAGAAGRPVIATRVGGMPEIVEHGRTGLLVEAGDTEGLAAALAELLHDRARAGAMGRAGRARAEERYSWSRVVAGLSAVHRRALSS